MQYTLIISCRIIYTQPLLGALIYWSKKNYYINSCHILLKNVIGPIAFLPNELIHRKFDGVLWSLLI